MLMNKTTMVTCLFIVAMAIPSQGQGFINLNFEDAKVSGSYGEFATSNALPGWSVFAGMAQLSSVQYNPNGISGPTPIELFGLNAEVIAGNFSASVGGNLSLSQTGLVPSGTESLLFDAYSNYLAVSLGGQNLSYSAIASGTNAYGVSYNVYAANVSGFAGQNETLSFSAPSVNYGILDDIQFSPEAIPEPSTALLLFLVSGILFYVRRLRKSR